MTPTESAPALKALPPARESFKASFPKSEAVWVTIETAAALIEMTPDQFRQHMHRKIIPEEIVRRLGKRCVRIHRQRLLEWMEKQ